MATSDELIHLHKRLDDLERQIDTKFKHVLESAHTAHNRTLQDIRSLGHVAMQLLHCMPTYDNIQPSSGYLQYQKNEIPSPSTSSTTHK